MLLERVRRLVEEQCGLASDDRVVVGVSGGPDSMCLLDLLVRLDFSLVAACLNHGLRPEAGREASHVEAFAASHGVETVLGRRDVPAYAAEKGLSLEEAARKLRYRFLFDVAAVHEAVAVAVGHTADDQVETLLMNLLRGAGLHGLAAMRPRIFLRQYSEDIALVRPLLSIRRREVLSYCRERKIEVVEDSSNWDLAFTRNRVRHELIPQLETFNPGVREALWRLSASAQGEHTLAERGLQQLKRELVRQESPEQVALDLEGLRKLTEGEGRALLHDVLVGLAGGAGPVTFGMADRALACAVQSSPRGAQVLGLGLEVLQEEGMLWAYRSGSAPPKGDWPQLSDPEERCLELPGRLDLEGGWWVAANRALPEGGVEPVLTGQVPADRVWLDASTLTGPLMVRGRRSGDRFQPLGLAGGAQKLSDFMINEKIPLRARARWPLVVCEGEIVWVAGHRPAHPFRLRKNTRDGVLLQLHRPGD